MLSARAPLSVKNENSVSSQMSNMALDKENTVSDVIDKTYRLTTESSLRSLRICALLSSSRRA